jgi:hypothetical protein
VIQACFTGLHHCALKRANTRRPLPLPGTLARTPTAFGKFAVSQMLIVAHRGGASAWVRRAFFALLASH